MNTIRTKVSNFKGAFESKQAFIKYVEAAPPAGEDLGQPDTATQRWSNIDLAPSPPQDRKWDQWTYLAFWVAHASNAGNWTAGSSLINVGLYPLDTWLALVFAHVLITVLIVINGRGPARYHVGFPVMARTTYGMWGSYMPVIMRAIVTFIWNGTNSYYGGRCVTVAITAIWPQFGRMRNTLPTSAGITTQDLISFFIFMAVFTTLSFFHSRDLKWLYVFKSIFVFGCMHAVLIWWMVHAGGADFGTLKAAKALDTTTHAWRVLQAFNVGLGTASSLTVNQGDMARYADKPSSVLWTTLIGYPISSALPCLYGILVASAAKKVTGTAFWNIWDTLGYMLKQYPDNHGARFGIFLCAVSFALAYLAVNLATNSLPFGSDITALFPRWMTIRRGQVLCTVLSICIVPWKILNNAKALITFLSGYGYFLAPIAALLSVDYFLVKNGNLKIRDVYIGDATSRYWFNHGVNWRAVSITILALLPCLPSFAASVDKHNLGFSLTAQRLFYISFVLTWFLAAVMYWVSYKIFPEKHLAIDEKSLKFEVWADEIDELERRDAAASAAERGEEEEEQGEKDVEKDESRSYVLSQ